MAARSASAKAASSATLAEALGARAARAVVQMTSGVDERAASEAVSASSDALVLLRLFERPEVIESLRASDPLAPARLRGVEARRKLIDLAGGLLSAEAAGDALGITRQAIEKRRRAGRLLSLSLGKRGYRYPTFQFVEGHTLPGLERVLDALRGRDPWTQVSFFVNRRSDLDGRSPVQLLQSIRRRPDRDVVDAVIEAAEADAEQGAA
ncbi:MAG TPA: hypothetical protein VHB78_05585 [Vicinamibacterales bacterium]|jgi:hypothetical protein|nr:hypothetical protein [Vicinamibacterales bacterium]